MHALSGVFPSFARFSDAMCFRTIFSGAALTRKFLKQSVCVPEDSSQSTWQKGR
jgi:hypothetical protein